MSSRESILSRLRSAGLPFPGIQPPQVYLSMSPLETDEAGMVARFIKEAAALNAIVYQLTDETEAIRITLEILGKDQTVLAWDPAEIPLPGLRAALEAAHVSIASPEDPEPRVGISGADAALAATGSLVLSSGPGRYRATSLLPPIHVAVIRRDQILPNLEAWVERQRADGLQKYIHTSNIVIISGPSRTSDIAMETILGMHGPGQLHILILGAD